jgi:hypothetical protein
MNKRLKKKKFAITLPELQTIRLEEDDFLLVKFDTNNMSFEMCQVIADKIKEKVGNKAVFITSDVSVRKYNK